MLRVFKEIRHKFGVRQAAGDQIEDVIAAGGKT